MSAEQLTHHEALLASQSGSPIEQVGRVRVYPAPENYLPRLALPKPKEGFSYPDTPGRFFPGRYEDALELLNLPMSERANRLIDLGIMLPQAKELIHLGEFPRIVTPDTIQDEDVEIISLAAEHLHQVLAKEGMLDAGTFTHEHGVADRVAKLSQEVTLDPRFEWPDHLAIVARNAAEIHDHGKHMFTTDFIHGGEYTKAEHEIMHQHPELGARFILQQIITPDNFLAHQLIQAPLFHHLHADGQGGYPQGYYDLPHGAWKTIVRMVSVADVEQAMKEVRSYRPYALPNEVVQTELTKGAHTKRFDPFLAQVEVARLDHFGD